MIASLSDWFKVVAPLFKPIRSETKTNRGSRVHIFPRLVSATCHNSSFLIGQSNLFGFGFTTLDWNFYQLEREKQKFGRKITGLKDLYFCKIILSSYWWHIHIYLIPVWTTLSWINKYSFLSPLEVGWSKMLHLRLSFFWELNCRESFRIREMCPITRMVTRGCSEKSGRAPVAQLDEHRAVWGRSWVRLRPDQHSGSLSNWRESAAFVITSAHG